MADPLFLLDSNICIYLLEGLSERAREHIESCIPGEAVTSSVAYAEILRGIDLSNRRAMRVVDAFFTAVPVLPFDRAAARAYPLVPFRRKSFDRLIAAHALSLDLTVATNNPTDFTDVPNLKVENWTI